MFGMVKVRLRCHGEGFQTACEPEPIILLSLLDMHIPPWLWFSTQSTEK